MNFKPFLFSLPLFLLADRGDLISYTKKAHVSETEHASLCAAFSVPCSKSYPCDIYTFKYATINISQTEAYASGVLIVPKSKSIKDLLVYLHGTVSNKEGAPSNLGFHMQLPLSVFAQGDFAIIIPDYLGIGDSSMISHPFCHASSLATASYDAIIAGDQLSKKLKLQKFEGLYITGYSEGGMAALALHAYVEKKPLKTLPLKASCPMSGPYDLSSSLSFALNSTAPRMNTYISYVIASYNLIYPGLIPNFGTVFSSDINYMIPLLFDGCHPFWEINTILNKISPLLNPEFIKNTLVTSSPFILKLAENDTYKFTPTSPIHFIGLEKDTEVGYLNSVRAYSYMKSQKAPVSLENASSDLDHMQGSALCHSKALKYFQSIKN